MSTSARNLNVRVVQWSVKVSEVIKKYMEETKNEVKRLYRSDTHRMFAGICGGLAEYTNTDASVMRLLWLLLTVFTGFIPGIVAYILAIFIVPAKPAEHTVHQ